MALTLTASLLPTTALADTPEGGNSIVYDGRETNEPTDEGETKDFDKKDEYTDPDDKRESEKEDNGAHECVFVDGWCECGKEEPAAPPIAQPFGAYALRTAGTEPEGAPVVQDVQAAVLYIGADGKTAECKAYTELTPATQTTLSTGWYVVDGTVTFSDTLNAFGEVHIILKDNATLKLDKGLAGVSLHIYGQSAGENVGKMVVSGEFDAGSNNYAAIYMDVVLEINSGKVTATGNDVADKEQGSSFGIYTKGELVVNGAKLMVLVLH